MEIWEPRWGMSFGISLGIHCALFLMAGCLVGILPHESDMKQVVEVDLVEMGGGGGGGGRSGETGPDIEAPKAEHPTAPPPTEPVPASETREPSPSNDVHQISETETSAAPDTASSSLPGGGHGNGIGSGDGDGVGPGSGDGTGGGHGHGIGSGNGDGLGPGDGGSDIVPPEILFAPDPDYPNDAQTAGLEGTVVVGMTVSVDGSVSSAWVISSSGYDSLDQAVVNAVYNYRFAAAKRGGIPIEVNTRRAFTFHFD